MVEYRKWFTAKELWNKNVSRGLELKEITLVEPPDYELLP